MADFGRVHAFAVTNRNGCVVYERFYDRLSEIQKAELRNSLGQCSRDVAKMRDGQVGVGNFRKAKQHDASNHSACRAATIVFQPQGPLVFFCVGSGEYDELTTHQQVSRDALAVLALNNSIVNSLKTAMKTDRPLTEQMMLAKYDKVCIVVDEAIHEGIADTLNANDVMASIKMAV